MDISVIVPTYNRTDSLFNTLSSLKNQSLSQDNYEIIVVDNNDIEDISQKIKDSLKCQSDQFIYIQEKNIGLHNARHAGAKIAKGEILAYTDDDAIYDSFWISEILKPYSDKTVGCVGGRVYPHWKQDPPKWVDYLPKAYLSLLDLGDVLKEVDYIYGLSLSIRKDLLFKLKGFNPESFGDIWLGDGEIGLLNKVRKAGFKIIYAPKAIAWHIIPPERLTITYAKRRFANEGGCASYADYKEKRMPPWSLMERSFMFFFHFVLHKLFALLGKMVRSEKFYVLNEVNGSFFLSRFFYELKLIYDNKLKNMVLKDNWLE